MTFAYPGWLMLLLILPFILLGAILAHRARSKAWQSMVAPRLRTQLVHQASLTRRWVSLSFALMGAALIIVAIARPYIGETTTTEQIRTRNILIAIDTSRSMLVRDGSPDRMASAQAAALELLETSPNDRVGIIAFSGAPVLMVPLTIDHAAVHETISQLDTNVIPSGGSNLNQAVELALKTFEKTGQKANGLVIISDGENHSQETADTANAIRDSGTTVCSISVGSEAGGMIPDHRQRDGKFKDSRGQTVLSRMIPDALDTLSRAGHGIFLPASANSSATVKNTLTSVKRHQQTGRKRNIPNEQYQWFLLPSIIMLALSMIIRSQLLTRKINPNPTPTTKKVVKAVTLSLFIFYPILGSKLEASTLDRAEKAYEQKNYQSALRLFRQALSDASEEDRAAIHFAMGTSAYRLKKWDRATTHFSAALLTHDRSLQENAHYNLAKSLFRSGLNTLQPAQANESSFLSILNHLASQLFGQENEVQQVSPEDLQTVITQWQDSIAHYQATLKLNPDNLRASSNQKNVQRLLDLIQQEKEADDKNNQGDDQGHQPETDPNNDPEQQKGEDPKEPGDDQKGEGDGDDPNKPNEDPNDQSGDNDKNKNEGQPQNDNQEKPNMERKDGETDEAYAARILKENSDAETRPVKRQMLRLRRPLKDW